MYTNKTKNMFFQTGDILIRQVFMREAQGMVWEVMQFRECSGQYAQEGEHAWLSYQPGGKYVEPFASRQDAVEWLPVASLTTRTERFETSRT